MKSRTGGKFKDRPGSKGGKENHQEIESTLPKTLEILGVFIFSGIGVGFTEASFHFLAFLCDFFAVACGVGLFCHLSKSLFGRYLWFVFGFSICMDFALFGLLYWHVKTENDSKPATWSVSIVPAESTNRKQPFESRFIIHNHSEGDISNVTCLVWAAPNAPKQNLTITESNQFNQAYAWDWHVAHVSSRGTIPKDGE